VGFVGVATEAVVQQAQIAWDGNHLLVRQALPAMTDVLTIENLVGLLDRFGMKVGIDLDRAGRRWCQPRVGQGPARARPCRCSRGVRQPGRGCGPYRWR
jgi:hypothetical protein